MEENRRKVESIIGIKFKDEEMELLKSEWKAFYENPLPYAGSAIIAMVNVWYRVTFGKAV